MTPVNLNSSGHWPLDAPFVCSLLPPATHTMFLSWNLNYQGKELREIRQAKGVGVLSTNPGVDSYSVMWRHH